MKDLGLIPFVRLFPQQAVEQLAALLADHGISEEEVVREFRARRART
jgi:hypothetical protein